MKKLSIYLLILLILCGCGSTLQKVDKQLGKGCDGLTKANQWLAEAYIKAETINNIDPNIISSEELEALKNVQLAIDELTEITCTLHDVIN